ncbi:hypothetical protein [Pyxidicoccus xibeiensis]|uniref:hypothetical protein n=1 Tax=Pyxidicoccus xibeiensis TaxID=2906759 RepID=UPI0020A7CDFC|nr:hypothetical protein [Pyxidicoccus xibeiensis]MCP3141049.1 hypothetical protein [Pyxidicoccus xibeiensis]
MSDDAWQRKVDHRLLALWVRVPEAERGQRRVTVMLRFAGPVEWLRRQGVMIGSVAGDVAPAAIGLADLARVAALPEVTFIELAQGLGPDAPAG